MDVDELTTTARACACKRPGVWMHPEWEEWLCERHAPALERRGRCSVQGCGKVAAWLHRGDQVWLCLDHAPAEDPGNLPF